LPRELISDDSLVFLNFQVLSLSFACRGLTLLIFLLSFPWVLLSLPHKFLSIYDWMEKHWFPFFAIWSFLLCVGELMSYLRWEFFLVWPRPTSWILLPHPIVSRCQIHFSTYGFILLHYCAVLFICLSFSQSVARFLEQKEQLPNFASFVPSTVCLDSINVGRIKKANPDNGTDTRNSHLNWPDGKR
jgi:hypothetical protein